MTDSMARVERSGEKMELYMRVSIDKGLSMERGSFNGLMAAFMKENL